MVTFAALTSICAVFSPWNTQSTPAGGTRPLGMMKSPLAAKYPSSGPYLPSMIGSCPVSASIVIPDSVAGMVTCS